MFVSQKILVCERIALVSPNHSDIVLFCIAGFRPGRRGPFVLAKGPKTIDAQSGLMGSGGTPSFRRASQLAPLKQGPPAEKSVPPLDQTAGVELWETNISVTPMKEGKVLCSVGSVKTPMPYNGYYLRV